MFDKELTRSPATRQMAQAGGGPPLLELIGASFRGEGAEVSLEQIDLVVHPGGDRRRGRRFREWPEGAGRPDPWQRRMRPRSQATVWHALDDLAHPETSVAQASSYIPENPLAMAAIPYLTVLENMALTRTSSTRGAAA